MTVAQARKLGYVTGSGNCIHTTRAAYRGVMDVEVSANGRINGLEVWGPQIVTKSGAHTGTTYSQLHKMLGAKLKKARYPYEGGYLYGWQVNDANRHMLFVFPSANTRSADKVRGILVFTGARMGSVAEC